MKKFLLSLQFLTIIPVRLENIRPKEISRSLVYFPTIGLLIGLSLAGINHLLYGFTSLLSAVLVTVSLVILTGGMHLDGLADTFDAIASGKNKEEMLKIMKDPHVGSMGILSMICILLLKVSLLASMAIQYRASSLILMCVISRWAMVFAISRFKYARAEGKAKAFFEEKNINLFILTTLLALGISILAGGSMGITIFAIVTAITYLAGTFINKRINGITGDSLGALNELAEAAVLLCACILTN